MRVNEICFFGEKDENLLIEIESACFNCFYFTTITSPGRSAKASRFIVLVEIASGVVCTVFIRAFQFWNLDIVCGILFINYDQCMLILAHKLWVKNLRVRSSKSEISRYLVGYPSAPQFPDLKPFWRPTSVATPWISQTRGPPLSPSHPAPPTDVRYLSVAVFLLFVLTGLAPAQYWFGSRVVWS